MCDCARFFALENYIYFNTANITTWRQDNVQASQIFTARRPYTPPLVEHSSRPAGRFAAGSASGHLAADWTR